MAEHERQLRDIELALDRVARAIEELVARLDQVIGQTENRRKFIRTWDLGRE